jgi:dTDP-4-dehydrorhamnose reductase
MRVWLTGASGFVGSNLLAEFVAAGDHVHAVIHRTVPTGADEVSRVDLLDSRAVKADVEQVAPDVVVHAAIRNDLVGLSRDRRGAWADFVDATRHVVDAANQVDAQVILISSDWVYDGRGGPATEDEPPMPLNTYGLLKLMQERVVLERARHGAVARVSGVNGIHREGRATIREQDVGFGYFVASLVDALTAGRTFTVWEAEDINEVATPSLASDAARRVQRIAARRLDGVLHCCGADALTRRQLAELTCEVFGLDQSGLRFGPPDPSALPDEPVPRDTSLDATVSGRRLEMPPLPGRALLEAFRCELIERLASDGTPSGLLPE